MAQVICIRFDKKPTEAELDKIEADNGRKLFVLRGVQLWQYTDAPIVPGPVHDARVFQQHSAAGMGLPEWIAYIPVGEEGGA